jgi:hypothetical protein
VRTNNKTEGWHNRNVKSVTSVGVIGAKIDNPFELKLKVYWHEFEKERLTTLNLLTKLASLMEERGTHFL